METKKILDFVFHRITLTVAGALVITIAGVSIWTRAMPIPTVSDTVTVVTSLTVEPTKLITVNVVFDQIMQNVDFSGISLLDITTNTIYPIINGKILPDGSIAFDSAIPLSNSMNYTFTAKAWSLSYTNASNLSDVLYTFTTPAAIAPPVLDSDNDGILDANDQCPTTQPDNFVGIKTNNYAYLYAKNASGIMATGWFYRWSDKDKLLLPAKITMVDTRGCSCTQIVALQQAKNNNDTKKWNDSRSSDANHSNIKDSGKNTSDDTSNKDQNHENINDNEALKYGCPGGKYGFAKEGIMADFILHRWRAAPVVTTKQMEQKPTEQNKNK